MEKQWRQWKGAKEKQPQDKPVIPTSEQTDQTPEDSKNDSSEKIGDSASDDDEGKRGNSNEIDHEKKWEFWYDQLAQFKTQFGHFKVPQLDKQWKKLYGWMSRQNRLKREGKLPEQRTKQLEQIGFVWNLKKRKRTANDEDSWTKYYNELIEFKKIHGHLDPDPSTDLKNWMVLQRKHFHKGTLSEARTKLLDEINFAWGTEKQKMPILSTIPQFTASPPSVLELLGIPFTNFILPSEFTQFKPQLDVPSVQSPLICLEQEQIEKTEQLG